MRSESQAAPSGRQLLWSTLSFVVCFAAWGLVSASAARFRELLHLTSTQTALLVAVPVLLGSLARIPMGVLTDRYGGRVVFSALMFVSAVPAALLPQVSTYPMSLLVGLFLGLAGSSFAVGVGHVSRWFAPQRQGGALGIYGLGNMGQSAAVFLGPVVAASYGWETVYWGVAVLLVLWGVAYWLLARNAPEPQKKARAGPLSVAREPLAWLLSGFYFLTFGGFVAFSIYLPTLLREQFALKPADAGFRTAMFVILATLCRPIGGWLSDHIGGARVLSAALLAIAPLALLMSWPSIVPFTVGALGCAALLGFGNGAVFKLVPQFFPGNTGAVTGLVGAMGGLGGFFPPLLLGIARDRLGVVWPGFLLLSATALMLWYLNALFLMREQRAAELTIPPHLRRTADSLRAGFWATLATLLLIGSIVVGSRNLRNFDPALIVYTFAVIFATWGVVYHYNVWLDKPPTRLYWERGWQMWRELGLFRALGRISVLSGRDIFAQSFIYKRSRTRWWMHQFLFWGCLLAVAVTFPLVFGWIYFRTPENDQMTYVSYVFGFPVAKFPLHSFIAGVVFHILDISSVLVLAGVALSLWRRLRDKGAQAVQSFATDFFPLFILFAISVTGIALTVAQVWLGGQLYSFLSILHAITVITGLLYLPFGKFFHIFQRPAQLGVKLYHQVGEAGEGAACKRCGIRFASRLHISDLEQRVLPQLGFDYRLTGPAENWQELCPACKRKTLAAAQLRLQEEALGQTTPFA